MIWLAVTLGFLALWLTILVGLALLWRHVDDIADESRQTVKAVTDRQTEWLRPGWIEHQRPRPDRLYKHGDP